MMKYVDTKVVFSELPNEITLAINISGCPCACHGCHSSYLVEDVGVTLTFEELFRLVQTNKGITAVSFMGGDANPAEINRLAHWIKTHTDLLTGWYSGRSQLSPDIELSNFNFIKLGPYITELGPLNSPTTNQRMYEVVVSREVGEEGNVVYALNDITAYFTKSV